MDTRGVKEKLDLGFLAEGREDRIILSFILNLEEDIEGFKDWNFEWKMETRRGGFRESLSLVKSREDKIILFYIEFGKGY